jgi:hypothetical protein
MTAQEAAFVARLQRRANTVSAQLAARELQAYELIRQSLSQAELVRAIESGQLDRLIGEVLDDTNLEPSIAKLRARVDQVLLDAAKSEAMNGLPSRMRPVAFDVLNPKVIESVRTLDTRVIQGLREEIRATVLQAAEDGLQNGQHPREVARRIRDSIGLAPNQEMAVSNFRRQLEIGDRAALNRALLGGRDAAILDRKLGRGMVRLYRGEVPFTAADTAELEAFQRTHFPDVADELRAQRGRWFGESEEQVRLYANRNGGKVYAVDVPREVAARYRRVEPGGEWVEYILPREYADKKRLLSEMGPPSGGLTPAQIDKMAETYRKRFIAHNAETHARTIALDAQKHAQGLAWEDAIRRGVVNAEDLVDTWVAVGGPGGDGRNRPEHLDMHGEQVPFGSPFSNGQVIPGETDYNCRCLRRTIVKSASARRAA